MTLKPYYENENGKLYCGDCLEIMPQLIAEGVKVDAVVTDPPYGVNLQPQRKLTQAIEGDGKEEARVLWREAVPMLNQLCKPDTSHLFFGIWSETWAKEILAENFTVKSCIVWVKNNFGIGYYTRPQHEFIWYCHNGTPPKPQQSVSDVWEAQKVLAPIHSCEKPVELMRRCVKFCAASEQVVLDPFAGSGTTLVAAQSLGRKWIGIEISPEYCEIAKKRLEGTIRQIDGQQSVFDMLTKEVND